MTIRKRFWEERVMTISDVSKKFDVSADTLRYCDRVGLVSGYGKTAIDVQSNGWYNSIKVNSIFYPSFVGSDE